MPAPSTRRTASLPSAARVSPWQTLRGPSGRPRQVPLPPRLRNEDSLDLEERLVAGVRGAVRATVEDLQLADLDDATLTLSDRTRCGRVSGGRRRAGRA